MSTPAPPTNVARPKIPGPPGPEWMHGLAFFGVEHRVLESCRERYGDVFMLKVRFPFERLIVLSDPGEIKRLFTADPTLVHAGEGNQILEPLVGLESVLLLDEEAHLRQRKLLLPPFQGDRMKVYGDLIAAVTEEEIGSWPVEREFAMLSSLQRITLRVICKAVFGIDDPARLARIEPLLSELLRLGQRAVMLPVLQRDLGSASPWRRFLEVRKKVDALIYDEIDERSAVDDLQSRSDVLSMLLAARDEDGSAMSPRALRDELITILIAGHETTASQLAWLFERLLRHPEPLERATAAAHGRDLGYLDAAIKESQRTRPVLGYALRKLTDDMAIGEFTAPRGSTVAASVWLVHHRADIYPNPEIFSPERFVDNSPDTYSWLSFGGGRRRCLGAAFAAYEMQVIAATILRECQLEAADPKPEPKRRRIITYVPSRGARVRLKEPVR